MDAQASAASVSQSSASMPPPPRPSASGLPRAHGPPPAASARPAPTTADLLAAIMAGQAQTNNRFDEVLGRQTELAAAVEAVDLRVDGVERALAEADARASATEARLRALEARPAPSAASSAASTRSGPTNPHGYDPYLTRVTAKQTVSFEAAKAVVRSLLDRARVGDGDIKFDGPMVGKVFYLRPRSADCMERGRIIGAIHDARRDSDGAWVELAADTPSGGRVPIFIDRDRSWAQRRKGYAVARVADAAHSVAEGRQVQAAKAAGTVLLDWVEVVSMAFDDDRREAIASWGLEKLAAAGVDSSAVLAVYGAAMAAASCAGQRG